ncbi:serine hydrolase domain-containing protein [Ferruginibacter sp. SUN106]|uniref:serine hydrolase domain-containing protein n=1 Tax=Ferruginibacter sp. SUN106 TaxID=2978348 RepID=UPI003D3660ED
MSYKYHSICRKFSLLAVLLLLLQSGYAQYNFSKVDDWLSNNLKEIGGRAVLVIYKDGKIVYSKAENELSGRQKRIGKFIAKRQGKDADEMMQDFTISTKERIASCSKWLSAAMVMTFVDEGKLSLEDSIGKFLPVMTANGKGNIKIWQCLSHLTGIKAGTLKESLNEMKELNNMDEAMASIATLPMEGEPGKTFHYSNIGLQIAGDIMEKISGKSFETLFAQRIAQPCNMKNSDFGKGKVALPAGGGWSTAEDYLNFLQMILHEGVFNGKQILSKASIIEMQKNRVAKDAVIASSPAEAGNWGYGLGEWMMEDVDGNQRSGAVTSPGLFGSFPWVDNNKQYAGFLMTFNIKNKGRNERYKELKRLVDEALATK